MQKMWQQLPKSLFEQPVTQQASAINPIKVTGNNTIEDIIGVTDSFWKSNHPNYQKIYEVGSNLSKCDLTTDSTVLSSVLQSITEFYKIQIRASELSVEEKSEELKKVDLLLNNTNQIAEIIKIFKFKLDKDALLAYILGISNNIYKQNQK
jgi:hypothetical protein